MARAKFSKGDLVRLHFAVPLGRADFDAWDVRIEDDHAVVVESHPMQTWAWAGKQLTLASIGRGKPVQFVEGGRFLNYPTKRVEILEGVS